jgi:hypothetical protein
MNSLNETSNQNSINLDELSTPVPKVDESRQKTEPEKSKELKTATKTRKSVEQKKSGSNVYEKNLKCENSNLVEKNNYIDQLNNAGKQKQQIVPPTKGQYMPTNIPTGNSELEIVTTIYEL